MKTRHPILAAALAALLLIPSNVMSAPQKSQSSSTSHRTSAPSSNWGRNSSTNTSPRQTTSPKSVTAPKATPAAPKAIYTAPKATPAPKSVYTAPAQAPTIKKGTPKSVYGVPGQPAQTRAKEAPAKLDVPKSVYRTPGTDAPKQPAAKKDTPKTVYAVPARSKEVRPPLSPQQKRTELDKAIAGSQSAKALAAVKADASKYKVTPPAVQRSQASARYVDTYRKSSPQVSVVVLRDRRGSFYADRSWRRPSWVVLGAPRYGDYDPDFLDWAYANDPLFFYNRAFDPAVIAWRHDRMRIAQENAELRQLMAERDAIIAQQTGARDETYLPPNVKPEIVLATDVVLNVTTPKLVFGSGVDGTTFKKVCALFKENAEKTMDIECATTPGSVENIRGFAMKKYQMIITSSDTMDWALRPDPEFGKALIGKFGGFEQHAYDETMWLLVRKDSHIKSVTDLKPGVDMLYVGPQRSGTERSYSNLKKHATKSSWLIFKSHNAQYEGVGAKNTDYEESYRLVSENRNAALLVLMPRKSESMTKVETMFGDSLRLVPLSGDKSFAKIKDREGKQVYHECTMPGGFYPKLIGASAVKTLCVKAIVVVADEWMQKFGKIAEDAFINAWKFTTLELEQIDGGAQ